MSALPLTLLDSYRNELLRCCTSILIDILLSQFSSIRLLTSDSGALTGSARCSGTPRNLHSLLFTCRWMHLVYEFLGKLSGQTRRTGILASSNPVTHTIDSTPHSVLLPCVCLFSPFDPFNNWYFYIAFYFGCSHCIWLNEMLCVTRDTFQYMRSRTDVNTAQ